MLTIFNSFFYPNKWPELPHVTVCSARDGRLKLTCALEKRAEYMMYRMESTLVGQELPPMKLARFQDRDGILWCTGRFHSSSKFKCEDVEMDLP